MKTLLLILATALNLFAAEDGSVLVYNGVSNSALATNVFKVTGGTNASLAGDLNLHNINTTNNATVGGSVTLSGASAASIALNAGGTISNGGGDFALTNDTPVFFQSNIVVNSTITDSAGSVGTSGQTLKSGGVGAGTTWGDSAGTFTFSGAIGSGTPGDSSTYYGGFYAGITFSGAVFISRYAIPIQKNCTLKSYAVAVVGTPGTAENVTVDLLVNGTTSVGSHAETWDSSPKRTITNGLSQALVSGDFVEIRIQTPTWATNPVVQLWFQVYCEF